MRSNIKFDVVNFACILNQAGECIDDQGEEEVAQASVTHADKERLSCLDHTLHLVVGEGPKESRCISTSLGCKLASYQFVI